MVFNLAENGNDIEDVKNLIQKAYAGPCSAKHVMRLGKANKNGCRSLRVEFASKDEALQVLKGKSKLKGSNVFINPDYTRRQQELNKSAQQQLIQRRSNGEKRQDTRNKHYARGGGVLIAVTKDIKSKVIQSSPFYEFLFVLAGQDINPVILAAAYFPPKSPVAAYVAFNEELTFRCCCDLKLYSKITSKLDCMLLQSDVQNVTNWCELNDMELNPNKCHVTVFHRSHATTQFQYSINGVNLNVCEHVKDLGVTFDPHLTFTTHISNMITKSLQLLGFVKRITQDEHPHS
ncbi:hypothetical protein JTB14_015702 [Gonioctena quinquepunctata]|nr:hypothetical protein JTB14_015702 [Gonioctena quinquepunctata]